MWQGLRKGRLSRGAADHCAYQREEKGMRRWQCPGIHDVCIICVSQIERAQRAGVGGVFSDGVDVLDGRSLMVYVAAWVAGSVEGKRNRRGSSCIHWRVNITRVKKYFSKFRKRATRERYRFDELWYINSTPAVSHCKQQKLKNLLQDQIQSIRA